eukprot:Lithocolla_globosa_v1_NODE_1424_length_2586_cov_58.797708.p1 type:complete len:130 gc:universal NODE_1424_length_2586_cov_58.797708:516-905(+)
MVVQCVNLQYAEFEWVENPCLKSILNTLDDNDYGYYLKFNGRYPKNLHDIHNDYPLMPQNEIIETEEMSKYSKKCKLNHGKEHKNTSRKLIDSLKDKKEYVIHYRNLKQAVSLGFEVTQVHKVMRFKQS